MEKINLAFKIIPIIFTRIKHSYLSRYINNADDIRKVLNFYNDDILIFLSHSNENLRKDLMNYFKEYTNSSEEEIINSFKILVMLKEKFNDQFCNTISLTLWNDWIKYGNIASLISYHGYNDLLLKYCLENFDEKEIENQVSKDFVPSIIRQIERKQTQIIQKNEKHIPISLKPKDLSIRNKNSNNIIMDKNIDVKQIKKNFRTMNEIRKILNSK